MRRRMLSCVGPDTGAKTARDYVHDGLIAMWDGIENAGWGVHDNSATTWKDLVGDVELSVVNGGWLDKAIQLSGGNLYNASVKSFVDAVSSGNFTIEYGGFFDLTRDDIGFQNESAGFKIGGNYNSSWISASTSTQGNTFWSKTNAASVSIVSAYPRYYESRFGWDDTMTNHASPKSKISASNQAGIGARKCSAQFVAEDGVCDSFVNCVFINSAMVNTEASYKNYGFSLGSYAARSYMTYNFFRVYNRALTSDEIAANYSVDNERFGLA